MPPASGILGQLERQEGVAFWPTLYRLWASGGYPLVREEATRRKNECPELCNPSPGSPDPSKMRQVSKEFSTRLACKEVYQRRTEWCTI